MDDRVVSLHSPADEADDQQDRPGQPGMAPPDVERSISLAAERVHAIIESAARVASEIRANARAEADSYLEEAKRDADRLTIRHIGLISDLAKVVSDRLEVHRRHSEELILALEDAMRALAATVGSNAASDRGLTSRRDYPTPPSSPGPSPEPEPPSPFRSEG
jgi:cell division septum initiation protein DivIVA